MNATEPTPITLPASSWNGVAALRITSMTRDDFSSTTLMATQLPYIRMIMKIRIVMPKPSMSWPMPACEVLRRLGLVRVRPAHLDLGGCEQRRLVAGRDAEPVEAIGDGERGRRLADERRGAAAGVVVGVEHERQLAGCVALDRRAGRTSLPSAVSARAASTSSTAVTTKSAAVGSGIPVAALDALSRARDRRRGLVGEPGLVGRDRDLRRVHLVDLADDQRQERDERRRRRPAAASR